MSFGSLTQNSINRIDWLAISGDVFRAHENNHTNNFRFPERGKTTCRKQNRYM